jgi:Arc/MetJ-type ribon-helix-helix transcriptional regulator
MKLSVSLPDEDVAYLDAYAAGGGYPSRSAVLRRAIRLLRAAELGPAYEEAFTEWERSGAAADWETTAGDGLGADAKG